jgi:hypothetical protein
LTPPALVIRRHGEEAESVPWESIESVSLSMPETKFKWPGLFSTIGLGVLAALLWDWGVLDEPENGRLELSTTTTDDELDIHLTRHHVGGYWTPTVSASRALLTRLVDDADARGLLDDPERVIRLVAQKAD